jgi:hypothetical protein
MMDFYKALSELYEEKKRLDRAISRVEYRLAMLSEAPHRSKRGRKNMSTEERRQVSERMTAYWAARRARSETPARKKNGESGETVGNGVRA